jgi:hypothetical protein
MRTLTLPLLLMGCIGPVHATNPWIDTRYPRNNVTVDGLYEACSAVGETARGDIPYFDCESYVYGVLDAYLKIRDQIPKVDKACFPASIEPWRVLQMADPKPGSYERSQSAASFLIDFLRKKYPCA